MYDINRRVKELLTLANKVKSGNDVENLNNMRNVPRAEQALGSASIQEDSHAPASSSGWTVPILLYILSVGAIYGGLFWLLLNTRISPTAFMLVLIMASFLVGYATTWKTVSFRWLKCILIAIGSAISYLFFIYFV